MQYIKTTEGYPALLKTRTQTPRPLFSESTLMHKNRTTPWVYLTQNPRGYWQVLAPDPNPDHPGEVICIAGGKHAAQVIHVMIDYAYNSGILKRGTQSARLALGNLGSFVRIYGDRRERL